MGELMRQAVIHKYNEEGERNKSINHTLNIGIEIFYVIYSVSVILILRDQTAERILCIIALALIIAATVINYVLIIKFPKTRYYQWIGIGMYFGIYSYMMFAFYLPYIQFSALIVLAGGIMYFRALPQLVFAIVIFFDNIIWSFINAPVSGIESTQIGVLIFMLCGLYTGVRSARICKKFMDDVLGSVTDEKQAQAEILSEVLDIASIVKANALESEKLIGVVDESTQIVTHSVDDISISITDTTENISEQTGMTQSIQDAIEKTMDYSEDAVDLTSNSRDILIESVDSMEKLLSHSAQIAATNNETSELMTKLSDKTLEVKDIVDIILKISKQTNLLALNASIESARAGESGRGFAVVAEQIRLLAEQTRESTESIRRIIEELGSMAEKTTTSVINTVESANEQDQLIHKASDGFKVINNNVSSLSDQILKINEMLAELNQSNSAIVDNISHISASSEEIASISQQASDIGRVSKANTEKMINSLQKIINATHRFDKYMN